MIELRYLLKKKTLKVSDYVTLNTTCDRTLQYRICTGNEWQDGSYVKAFTEWMNVPEVVEESNEH